MKLTTSLLLLGTATSSANTIGKSLQILHSHPDLLSRHLQFGDFDDFGACPSTCPSPEVCTFYESQTAGVELDASIQVLEDACDAGTLWDCAPDILSTACGFCGDGGGLLAAFVSADEIDVICSTCEFLNCCQGSDGYDVCSESLPEGLFGTSSTSVATTEATSTAAATTSVQTTTVEDGVSTSTATEAATTTTASVTQVATEAAAVSSTTSTVEESSTTSTESEQDDILNIIEGNNPFGQIFGGDTEGSDDFFGSIGDFIGGIFGGGETGDMNYTVDDDWNLDSVFNQSGQDDLFETILGGGLNQSDGTSGGWGDMLGGLIEAVGGIFGGMGSEDGDWVDKGNFTGWHHDDMMFGSPMMCSEDNACPVDGFCECMSGDLSKCSLTLMDDMCSSGAAFSCAPEGFEEMCNNDCPPLPRRLQGQSPFVTSGNASASVTQSETESYSAPNCMMCNIARCCESEGTTMNQCAMEVGIDPDAVMMNLTDIGQVLGEFVNDIIENVTMILDELIGNVTVPEFCPSGTCPVDGFCECFQGDFMQCNEQVMRDACENDAFFGECGPENFQDFCLNECNGEVESMEDMINMALCSMCTVATCCHEQGSADECFFTGLSFTSSTSPVDQLATDSSSINDETTEDSSENESEATEKEVGNDIEADGSISSALEQEDGSSSASIVSHAFMYGTLVASALISFILSEW